MLTPQHFDWKLWINPGNNSPQSHYSSLQEAWVWPHITTLSGANRHRLVPHRPDPLQLQQEFDAAWDFPTICCTLTALTYTGSCVFIISYYFICLPVSRGRGKLPCKPSPLSWRLAFVKAILDRASNNDSHCYACSFVSLDTLAKSLQAKAWISQGMKGAVSAARQLEMESMRCVTVFNCFCCQKTTQVQ